MTALARALASSDPLYLMRLSAADLTQLRTELLAWLDDTSQPDDARVFSLVERMGAEIDRRQVAATQARAQQARQELVTGVASGRLRSASTTVTDRSSSSSAPHGAATVSEPSMRIAARTVVDSSAFADFRARGYSGQMAIDVPAQTRALLDNAPGSLGAFQNPARPTDVPMANSDRQLRLADLIDRRPTDSNTVEYVQETSAAGAGGTAAETAEGSLKPEATFTFQVVTDSVRTVAHWVNITRQSADDNAQMTGYIEGRLGYGLEYRLDSQILNGSGTAPNLRGILNTSGIGTYVAGAGEAAVLSIRKAITVAQGSEYAPDTAVMNPTDWERIELSTDSQGMFRVSPNVANSLAPRIWGLNVVPTTAIAAATVLVGSFRMGATLWEREGIRVLMTDSHASNFTSNILTLLAEMRAALSVWRPKAFVRVTLAAGTN